MAVRHGLALAVLGAFAIAGAPAVGQAPIAAPVTVAPVPKGAVEAVEAFLRESRAPGASVAVRFPDGAIWTRGFGLADVENDVAVTADTVFRLASISKPITATIAMRLVARGALDLDAPVHTLVPEWPEKQWPVTTRLLMGHLGGVRHYRGHEILSNTHYTRVAGALAIFSSDPLESEPGTRYRYTTYGFNLVGAVCAATAKRRFRDLIHDEIAVPAGCATLQVDDYDRLIPHRAQGYRLVRDELRNAAPVDTSNKIPGGGMCATAADLVHFAGALLDGTLLDAEHREMMWTEQHTRDGKGTGYGLGWGVGTHDGHRVVSHTGAQPRVSTILVIDVDAGVSVAVLCDLEGQGRRLRRLAESVVAGAFAR